MGRLLVKTADMPREEWLSWRRKGIGGSDASTICGFNPYSSLISLYADKMGLLPDKEDSEAMRIGRDLEDYVAKRFCEKKNKKVRRRNAMFCHDKYEYITANVDREIVGENAGLECKTTSAMTKCDFENEEIPLNYLCQCRHYMNVMGYDRMYLAVLVLGRGFYVYTIEYDKAEGDALLELEIDFWQTYIVANRCPDPDGSDNSMDAVNAIHGQGKETEAMIESGDAISQYIVLNTKIKEAEELKKKIKQKIIVELNGSATGFTREYIVCNPLIESKRVDTDKLKREFPDIYNAVARPIISSRFTVKERK